MSWAPTACGAAPVKEVFDDRTMDGADRAAVDDRRLHRPPISAVEPRPGRDGHVGDRPGRPAPEHPRPAANRPTLDYGSRRWLGGEPKTYQSPAGSSAVEGTDSNPVLAPRDPNNPYSASGGGYTRQGTTIIGPTGDSHSIVGSTVFGPGGRPCSVVGNSLFCN